MFASIAQFFVKIIKTPAIRRKLIITFLILIVFRLVSHIPLSGVDTSLLKAFFSGSTVLSLMNIFSGGTLGNFSIVALGIGPYINASIIMQLLTFVVPQLEELSKEPGDYGQEKINQYTRFLSIPLAAMQGFGMYLLLHGQGIIKTLSPIELVALIVAMIAGTMLTVWMGELISEYGVGNGVSFIIFAGIISSLPTSLLQLQGFITTENLIKIGIFLVIALLVIGVVVFMNEAIRRIPIQYARRQKGAIAGASSFLPLKLNQSGVYPLIFALSLILMPSMISNFLGASSNTQVAQIAQQITTAMDPQSLIYNIVYFVLVFGFTYLSTMIVFSPEKMAEGLQKNGGFVPGIRPGPQTQKYLSFVLNRITLVGALFLGLIAILPSVVQQFVAIPNLVVGGTGILIVVSVVIDLAKDLESQLIMRRYDSFIK